MVVQFWKLSLDGILLALESQAVICMRVTSAVLGRGTHAENARMVTEKAAAFVEASATLAGGGSTHTDVRTYRKRVRANARRLRSVRRSPR
jgi:hypothetical protein